MLDLLAELLRRHDAREPLVLVTLVRARGSTPQKAGAALLVLPTGHTLGTLGGGCVEAEARRLALAALAAGTPHPPTPLSFKLDHDFGWDDGLVCGGIMDLALTLLLPTDDPSPYRDAHARLSRRHPATLTFPSPDASTQPLTLTYAPPLRLVIAGAGHVAHALAALAPAAGFHLTVIDDRPDFASPDRFPAATLLVGPIDTELARLPLDPATSVVIVTRGHKNDAQALAAALNRPTHDHAGYIGLIGSKRKIRTILALLHDQGTPRDRLASVHAPIGLDLGAITPGEIAISILAQLIAARHGKADSPIPPMRLPPDTLDTYLTHRPT